MPSGFILDLVDHKRRVAGYLRVAAQIFLEWLATYDNIIAYPISTEEMDLFDLFDVACNLHGRCRSLPPPNLLVGQVQQIAERTSTLYLAPCRNLDVAHCRAFVISDLFQRAVVHDNSKYSEEEFEPYERAFPMLQRYAYGSEEFKAALRTIQPALDHHYHANDHHPEFFENGIADMHNVQLIEMTCDWLAASERSQKNVFEGLEINQKRFGIEPPLAAIIKNTIPVLQKGG